LTQLADVSPAASPAEIHQGLLNALRELLKKQTREEQMPEKGWRDRSTSAD
jgi:hypothetical protein